VENVEAAFQAACGQEIERRGGFSSRPLEVWRTTRRLFKPPAGSVENDEAAFQAACGQEIERRGGVPSRLRAGDRT